MPRINEHYLKLKASYLFAEIEAADEGVSRPRTPASG